jgi:hypothetical protein
MPVRERRTTRDVSCARFHFGMVLPRQTSVGGNVSRLFSDLSPSIIRFSILTAYSTISLNGSRNIVMPPLTTLASGTSLNPVTGISSGHFKLQLSIRFSTIPEDRREAVRLLGSCAPVRSS